MTRFVPGALAVGLLLVSTATSRAPAGAKSKSVALPEAKQRGKLVRGVVSVAAAGGTPRVIATQESEAREQERGSRIGFHGNGSGHGRRQ